MNSSWSSASFSEPDNASPNGTGGSPLWVPSPNSSFLAGMTAPCPRLAYALVSLADFPSRVVVIPPTALAQPGKDKITQGEHDQPHAGSRCARTECRIQCPKCSRVAGAK
ncbi:hypothetical protein GCM10017566_55780 [Amycolatopsis bartoniae]|uniref:Uncharacterized protein n=1 Tax=Amycolatopsis bartoniae TaxID=941986 RepID=A0A8H9IXQ6_9PSEU|nr:hypothetical protein GCM10017566_55780 [Amycolatopsis bartoniae]